MSGGRGFIKLHRTLRDHWLWSDASKLQAWIDLLMRANHAPRKFLIEGTLVSVERGEFITSKRGLAVDWKWSRKKTERFLEMLENDEMVSVKVDHQWTRISIVNYSIYQDKGTTEEATKGATEGTTEEPPRSNKQEGSRTKKNDQEDPRAGAVGKPDKYRAFSESDFIFPPKWGPNSKAALREWIEFKAAAKTPCLLTSYQTLVDRFKDDPRGFVAAVTFSKSNGYQGLIADRSANGNGAGPRKGRVTESGYSENFVAGAELVARLEEQERLEEQQKGHNV